MHRSALGKQIDMAALVTKNEKVRAVGNMNVNARGDIIDNNGRIVQENTHRVNSLYKKTIKPPSNIEEDVHEVVEHATTPIIETKSEVITAVVTEELNTEEQKMFEEFDEDYEEVEEIKQNEIKSKAKK